MEIRQRDSLRISPSALWLILPPLLIFAGGDILQHLVGWHPGNAPAPGDPPAGWQRSEAAARLTMMAAFLAALAVGLAALFMCASDALRLFGSGARRILLIGWAAAIGLLAAWVVASTELIGIPPILDYLGKDFVGSALKRVEPGLPTELWWINMIVRVAFVLGGVGVIVATISCLAEPVRTRPLWARQALRRLQRRRLRRYVNLGAAVMTTGLLFMVAWMRWPGILYSGAEHSAYVAQVNALALYFGVYYSAIIASYYVPVAAILNARDAAALLGKDGKAEGDGFIDRGSADVAGKGLAMMVPAIAGIAPALFELLRAGAGG